MKNKKGFVLLFLCLLILIIDLTTIFTPIIIKNNSITKGEKYIINRINSDKPFHTEAVLLSGDINKCTNCRKENEKNNATIYPFFISKALGNKLNKNEINIITKEFNTKDQEYDLWGYYRKEQQKEWNDADDTAFIMRAFENLNIKYNINDIGYFYNKSSKSFDMFMPNDLFKGIEENYKSQPEVNANIFSLLQETKQNINININTQFIIDSQNKDGSFKYSYYPSKYYSSYMFLNFLCKNKKLDKNLIETKNKAINFLINSQNKDGSWGENGNDYETSMSLSSLKLCGQKNTKTTIKAENILMKHQKKDGSWDSKELFWKFQFDKDTSWGSYTNDLMTTSLAIEALKN